jgi:hypothetical protein
MYFLFVYCEGDYGTVRDEERAKVTTDEGT